MKWVRAEFQGLHATQLAKVLLTVAAVVALIPAGYAYFLLLFWVAER